MSVYILEEITVRLDLARISSTLGLAHPGPPASSVHNENYLLLPSLSGYPSTQTCSSGGRYRNKTISSEMRLAIKNELGAASVQSVFFGRKMYMGARMLEIIASHAPLVAIALQDGPDTLSLHVISTISKL
jgi:hypothetical protein